MQKELDAADEILVIRGRIAALEIENAELASDHKELIRRIQVIEANVSAIIREVQAGVQKRPDSGYASLDTKTIIETSIKAGFGASLGVVATIVVVQVVSLCFSKR